MFSTQIQLLILFCSTIDFSNSVCRKSYITICDSISDVQYNPNKKTWTELLIQQKYENSPSRVLTSQQLPRELSHLKWLIINEELVKIEGNAFTWCKNLKQLILYGNNIKTIQKSTFLGFKNLTKLSLENSNVEEINSRAFILSTFGTVDLSYNKLKKLGTDSFRKCTVTTLKITHNELEKIDSDSLPKSIKFLHLDHNILDSVPQELENLIKLQELTISHNRLKNVEVSQLHTLEKLDLSFNNIATITREFNTLQKLKYLDLSSNNIEKFIFTPQFLQNIKDQFYLLLAHNRLINLDLEAISKAAVILTLSGNPWNCKCMDKMLQVISTSKITNTICDHLTLTSGGNPYCIVEDNQRCSEDRMSAEDLESFQKAAKNKLCDIFGDTEPYIK